jgi:mRNA interferase HigB
MRIISRNKLVGFLAGLADRKEVPAVKSAVESWYAEAKTARWNNSADIRARYATASVVAASRVVFNIQGNDYRLIVEIDYEKHVLWTIWIGSHADYDKLGDVRKVRHEN